MFELKIEFCISVLLVCTQNNKCCFCIFFSDKNQETIENKPTTTELAVPEKDEKSTDCSKIPLFSGL